MFGVEVSGVIASKRFNIGAAIQTISHRDHLQFSAATENPAIKGPRAGPPHAEKTHQHRGNGTYRSEYMSEKAAPALARAGLPKNPRRNLKTKRPAKLSTTAVGKDKAKNKMNVIQQR
jgi:hypothetical protein